MRHQTETALPLKLRGENCAHVRLFTACVVALSVSGCSGTPARIKQQELDPSSAAARAMETYDSNEDGAIDRDELESSPPLKSAVGQIDKDGDGRITIEEIEVRLNSWIQNRSALFPIPCRVTMGGRPLAGATVVFEPEPFLGDAFQTAIGITDEDGMAGLSVSESGPSAGIPGIPNGLYRVRISKLDGNREKIPKKYNEETVIGQEICDDAAGIGHGLVYNLSAR